MKNKELYERLKPLATALRIKVIRLGLEKDERDQDAFMSEILIILDEMENLIATEWK